MTLDAIAKKYKISRSQVGYLLRGAGTKVKKTTIKNRIKLDYDDKEVDALFERLSKEN